MSTAEPKEKQPHRTPKPLRIWVDLDLYDTPEVQELVAKGHEVVGWGFSGADLVLSPKAWRMTRELLKYLPISVKAARAVRWPRKGQGAC